MASKKAEPRDDRLDALFKALSDRTRRKMLLRLRDGQATVSELAEPFDMSLPAVSKHLTVLERAGLLSRVRDGRTQRCTMVFAPLRDARAFLDGYSAFWNDQLNELERYLAKHDSNERRG